MSEIERDLVHSEAVKAGKRIYYFDVKQSRNGERYIAITESKKLYSGDAENPQVSFEKHKLFLYKEDYEKFRVAFDNALRVASEGLPADFNKIQHTYDEPAPSDSTSEAATALDDLIKL
ncbi:MAG: PUR family DNA/RNA-binding protein [Bacteroidaceae bacterium]|nr:PUR family DNA/RNA-binding protein [Bacteroidaceae bacterium]